MQPAPHVALGELAAVGVERESTAGVRVALCEEAAALTNRAETEGLENLQHPDSRGVLDVERVDVLRSQAGARPDVAGDVLEPGPHEVLGPTRAVQRRHFGDATDVHRGLREVR